MANWNDKIIVQLGVVADHRITDAIIASGQKALCYIKPILDVRYRRVKVLNV